MADALIQSSLQEKYRLRDGVGPDTEPVQLFYKVWNEAVQDNPFRYA